MQTPSRTPRAALVTGAATRLGRHIALALAHHGWDIAIHYRHSASQAHELAKEITALGRKTVCVSTDLGNEQAVAEMFGAACEGLAHLNCVVNNASQFNYDQPQNAQPAALRSHFAVNLIGPLLLTQLLHQRLQPHHRPEAGPAGVVIHLLDQKLVNPNPDFFSYTLSKAALQEAMRLSAMAMAPVLRVVGVAPGLTLPSADQTPEEFARAHAMTPLNASSHPDDIADAVAWLAAARAVTGTMLLVDGGQHLAAQPRDIMMMIRQ